VIRQPLRSQKIFIHSSRCARLAHLLITHSPHSFFPFIKGDRGFISSGPLQGIQGLLLFRSPPGDSGAPPLQVPFRGFRGSSSSAPLQGIQGLLLFSSPSGDSGASSLFRSPPGDSGAPGLN